MDTIGWVLLGFVGVLRGYAFLVDS